MLKIVEVHPSQTVRGEYIVLQNQGVLTVSLRGWALCTDAYLQGDAAAIADSMYVFRHDIAVRPYTCVVLFTCEGEDGWEPTTDGKQAYCAFWGRQQRVWSVTENIHILQLAATKRVVTTTSAAVTAHA